MLVFDRALHGRDVISLNKIAPRCKGGFDSCMKRSWDRDFDVEQRELGWIE
jgi:hypothetical protein